MSRKNIIFYRITILLFPFLAIVSGHTSAQGTWTPLINAAPDGNLGVMLLLSDGSVMVKTATCFYCADDGDTWDRLTPDIYGSYLNGTWSSMAVMGIGRLYFSSQVLTDARVYVAGGEWGTGAYNAEIYDPVIDAWSMVPSGGSFFDANSAMLPDGRILQAKVIGGNSHGTYIYDPTTNSYSVGPNSLGSHDETTWIKLRDNSVLFVDDTSRRAERYIPSPPGIGSWVADANTTASLYDYMAGEIGSAQLLPDGRAIFFGGAGNTQYYTPSGSTAPGTWTAGPTMPAGKGAPDAPSAMMINGKILCSVSDTDGPLGIFPSPTYFYEFDYLTNTWTPVASPVGGDTLSGACYKTSMLPLPDGNVLFASFGMQQYYIYTPSGSPLPAGKPTLDTIIQITCTKYMATGKLFNGIAIGATYGDDWQMASNYPLVRLTSGTQVYYARTYNWNSTGVQRDTLADTTYFDLPAGLPYGTYNAQVVANGNPSASRILTMCTSLDLATTIARDNLRLYPNPTSTNTNIRFYAATAGTYTIRLIDMTGRTLHEETGNIVAGYNARTLHLPDLPKGGYMVSVITDNGVQNTKLVVE